MDCGIILLGFGFGQVVSGLEIEPEARIGVEIAAEPDRRVGGDVTALAQDVADPVAGDAERLGKRALIPSGSRYSSRRTSPGCVLMRDMARFSISILALGR